MSGADESAWWSKTWNLMVTVLVIWAFFGFVIHIFVRSLNEIVIAGFPLGYYMAAQGSLIVFRGADLLVCQTPGRDRSRRRRGRAGLREATMSTSTQSTGASDFTNNLGKIYGIYTGGFLGFVILLAILEQLGLPNRIIGYLFVFLHTCRLCRYWRSVAHHAGVRILRGRTPGSRRLQRHGDGGGLDVGRIVCRHGRNALCARL